jgi:hypothetical protein
MPPEASGAHVRKTKGHIGCNPSFLVSPEIQPRYPDARPAQNRSNARGDSDEGDRWFRTDGDQRSGIDVISRRSEATLANGFCRK